MKIARFSTGGDPRFGILDDTDLVVLTGDPMFSGFETTGERVSIAAVKLLAPVIPRSKVVAVGKNYVDHVAEFGGDVPTEPLLFLKPNTAVVGPDDAIVLPRQSNRVDFEGELAIVIGSIAKNVAEADAAAVIFGYTIANDVTARDLQKSDGQWARAKGFDSFCPLGPVIETEFDVAAGTVETRLNGEVRQSAPLTDMVHGVAAIVAYASSVFTLLPGDVILTGTPPASARWRPAMSSRSPSAASERSATRPASPSAAPVRPALRLPALRPPWPSPPHPLLHRRAPRGARPGRPTPRPTHGTVPYVAQMNTPDPTHMIRTTVYLPATVISSARAAAVMRGITVAAVIRSALESGLGAYRPPPAGGFLSGKRRASDDL